MFDFIVNDALKNVWCAPGQDRQHRVKPVRLSPPSGSWNWLEIQRELYTMPLQGHRFHVYQIGQLHPSLMGLFPQERKWVTMAEACNRENLIVDLYVFTGVQIPRFQVWYMVTESKNLLIAVKDNIEIPANLSQNDLYIRVYKNAFFGSGRDSPVNDKIVITSKCPLNKTELLDIQNKFFNYKQKPGHAYAFVNGYKVNELNLFTSKLGDYIEIVYDSSIYRIVDFQVGDLPFFTSTMDAKHKYLLHYPGQGSNGIDYEDDVDVFIYKPGSGDNHIGVYYHRNREDAMRMLTHKDYSVPVAYVTGYTASHAGWEDVNALRIRLHIRKAGYDRPLVNESGRIKELYKLNDPDIPRAMIGVDATVPGWKAENLESAAYTAVMRSLQPTLSRALVQACYGYNGISKLSCDTPMLPYSESGQKVVKVPYGLWYDATGFEYDAQGLLLGWYPHIQGGVYACRSSRCALVEMIAGQCDDRLDEQYGRMDVGIDPAADYRMYVCPIVGGNPTNKWVDVTGSNKYAMTNNGTIVHWLIDPAREYTLVRGNKKTLAYRLDLSANDGLFKFSLNHLMYRNEEDRTQVMQISMGELDLFMNGRSLIEDVDYIVQFPQIVIINKKYLINPMTQAQKLVIRFSGFCKSDMSREKCMDRGFISHGLLSDNDRFDIRDDKVLRMVVGGAVYDRSELKFAEEGSGVEVPDAANGLPYLIRDIVVPLRGLAESSTYPLREISKVIDKEVSDYMTLKFPPTIHHSPNIILKRYAVVSPFTVKLLFDLKNKILDDERLTGHYDDNVVTDICKPYEYLLAYDPATVDNRIDEKYVVVHPHSLDTVVNIDLYAYTFLSRAIKIYLKDVVRLDNFVTLTA
jgi:hypothetical protein